MASFIKPLDISTGKVIIHATSEEMRNIQVGQEVVIRLGGLKFSGILEHLDTNHYHFFASCWQVEPDHAVDPNRLEVFGTDKPEILKFFNYEHLPNHLQEVSRPLHGIAHHMASTLPPSAELSAGLRKLLEAKDCFVRASLTRSRVEKNNG